MGRIRVKSANVGMVLSADVLDVSGRLLVPKGTTLTEKHLKVFRTWGIAEVNIESDSDESEDTLPAIPAEILKTVSQQVDKLFVANDMQHELINEIYRLVVDRKARDLMKGSKI